ncbi:MAG TPA: MerR family transcriptional regulator [Lachnospiraceae bacterium]|nr:MerR family transcriptional regulator [Lachnospiraceae bacterium]
MKINEVEQAVGITKKNIRFYEEQGLLNPERNKENGYREYGEQDVEELNKIKLLRKLSVPIEEIRKIQNGSLTLEGAIKRQVIVLEREQENLVETMRLCKKLAESECQYLNLHPQEYLLEMAEMEKEGTRFMNIMKNDKTTRMLAPIIITIIFCALMVSLMIPLVMAAAGEHAPAIVTILCVMIPICAAATIIAALRQRMKEIKGGEEDVARKY